MTDPADTPTPEERCAAVCRALASAPGLVRLAARFAPTFEDAEDAYQRAMEIALTRAPVVEHERFMAWLRAVIRNEALALGERGRREGPLGAEDAAETAARRPDGGADPQVQAELRMRYRSLQDALADLTEAQRICVILQAGGASYRTIIEVTGFTRRKVERSILEGRAALSRWEEQLLSGDACARVRPSLRRVAEGHADRRERFRVSRHTRHCLVCRALLREGHRRDEWLGMLAPVALLAGTAQTAPPDPAPLLSWFERITTGATVRMGSVVQMTLEMPGSAAAKVGGAAAAAVVAGSAGVPLVADLVDGGPARMPEVGVVAEAGAAAPQTAVPAPAPVASAPVAPRPRPVRRPRPPVVTARIPSPRLSTASLHRVAAAATARPAPARASVPAARSSAAPVTTVRTARHAVVTTTAPPPPSRSAPARVAGPRAISIGPGAP